MHTRDFFLWKLEEALGLVEGIDSAWDASDYSSYYYAELWGYSTQHRYGWNIKLESELSSEPDLEGESQVD